MTREWKHLAPQPRSSYQQLYIKNRGISARTLYGRFMSETAPMSVAAIAADYGLPVEAVREAIEYCQADPPEIREDFEREERLLKASGRDDEQYAAHPYPKVLTAQEISRLNARENIPG